MKTCHASSGKGGQINSLRHLHIYAAFFLVQYNWLPDPQTRTGHEVISPMKEHDNNRFRLYLVVPYFPEALAKLIDHDCLILRLVVISFTGNRNSQSVVSIAFYTTETSKEFRIGFEYLLSWKMMFPDDYTLASGRAVKSMLESPSPEVDSECCSPRGTPEAPSPEQPNVQLVRYVRLGVPNKAEMVNEAPIDGSRSVRQAISLEIPPDSETLTLKKALSTKSRRRSGNQGNNFEIPSTKDRSVPKSSNIQREMKEKWKRATSYASKKAKETMKPVNSDRDLESPFGAKWYPEVQHSYPKSESSVEELDNIEEDEALNCVSRIKYTKVGSRKHRGMDDYSGADGLTPTEAPRIADIEKIMQKEYVDSTSGRTVLQISGAAVLPPRAPITDTRAGTTTISPLPTTEQIKAAKAVYNGYRPDSASTCSGSGMTSGYSDMIACSPGIVDHWTREAEANPFSEYDELQPRFSWLKRSVAPFTAIAGAILVSVASMSSMVLES